MTTPWGFNPIPAGLTADEIALHLNRELSVLEQRFREVRSSVEYGPVPGSYFPVSLGYSDSGGITAGSLDLVGISFEARPIAAYLTVFGTGAQVTVQVKNSSTNLFASNQSVSTGSPVTLNERGDFAVDKVYSPDLNLELISVDAGTPIHVRATVILKNLQKVEPA